MVLKIATVSFLGTVALGVGLLLSYRPIMAGVRVLVRSWENFSGKGKGKGVSASGDNRRGLLATTLDEDVEKRRRR